MVTAEVFIAAVQAAGSDVRDARDAAHEACHALRWKVKPGKWDRDGIHRKSPKRNGDKVYEEIVARAVEQLVCKELGVDCGSVEKWAMVCLMEQGKMEGIWLPGLEWLVERVTKAMAGTEAKETARMVVGFADKPAKRRRTGANEVGTVLASVPGDTSVAVAFARGVA